MDSMGKVEQRSCLSMSKLSTLVRLCHLVWMSHHGVDAELCELAFVLSKADVICIVWTRGSASGVRSGFVCRLAEIASVADGHSVSMDGLALH
ncbi:hypothetical protein BpHYR1_012124 [Brachionus plicatilis]|uniref:Uncharacterized protein n=1 Tax=Brachionus plicatilis TaxID=10195 RepID=A0A3M7T054_BRAPC|nr:hypothetical protein BpHYR1_012124 [Brachionus plicatilis]